MGDEELKKCETCGQRPNLCSGTKEERIRYYLDSAMRMGACLGQWTDGQDRVVKRAAVEGMDAVKSALLRNIMEIVDEKEGAQDGQR